MAGPERTEPREWEHYELFCGVREALYALPGHFKSQTKIEGIQAKDIFTLNTFLGATIEEEVVRTLNELRTVWDPRKKYQTYVFVRQPQMFPDVRLQRRTDGEDILLGIELKGWYVLAKEGEPSFRFKVSPKACNPWDLLVVVPWVLSEVLSGSPRILPVFVDSARYLAEVRNYYWMYERKGRGMREGRIREARDVRPYPRRGEEITDEAEDDKGGNFGRIARYGTMEEYVKGTMEYKLKGVAVGAWLKFFREQAGT